MYAAEEKNTLGYVPSINENLAITHAKIQSEGVGATINERTEAFNAQQKEKSIVDIGH